MNPDKKSKSLQRGRSLSLDDSLHYSKEKIFKDFCSKQENFLKRISACRAILNKDHLKDGLFGELLNEFDSILCKFYMIFNKLCCLIENNLKADFLTNVNTLIALLDEPSEIHFNFICYLNVIKRIYKLQERFDLNITGDKYVDEMQEILTDIRIPDEFKEFLLDDSVQIKFVFECIDFKQRMKKYWNPETPKTQLELTEHYIKFQEELIHKTESYYYSNSYLKAIFLLPYEHLEYCLYTVHLITENEKAERPNTKTTSDLMRIINRETDFIKLLSQLRGEMADKVILSCEAYITQVETNQKRKCVMKAFKNSLVFEYQQRDHYEESLELNLVDIKPKYSLIKRNNKFELKSLNQDEIYLIEIENSEASIVQKWDFILNAIVKTNNLANVKMLSADTLNKLNDTDLKNDLLVKDDTEIKLLRLPRDDTFSSLNSNISNYSPNNENVFFLFDKIKQYISNSKIKEEFNERRTLASVAFKVNHAEEWKLTRMGYIKEQVPNELDYFKHDLRQGQKVFIGNCHKFRSTKVYEVTLPSPSIEILDKFCLLPESYLSVDESNKPSKISNYTQILADLNLLVGVIASFVESFSYFINSILSNVDLLQESKKRYSDHLKGTFIRMLLIHKTFFSILTSQKIKRPLLKFLFLHHNIYEIKTIYLFYLQFVKDIYDNLDKLDESKIKIDNIENRIEQIDSYKLLSNWAIATMRSKSPIKSYLKGILLLPFELLNYYNESLFYMVHGLEPSDIDKFQLNFVQKSLEKFTVDFNLIRNQVLSNCIGKVENTQYELSVFETDISIENTKLRLVLGLNYLSIYGLESSHSVRISSIKSAKFNAVDGVEIFYTINNVENKLHFFCTYFSDLRHLQFILNTVVDLNQPNILNHVKYKLDEYITMLNDAPARQEFNEDINELSENVISRIINRKYKIHFVIVDNIDQFKGIPNGFIHEPYQPQDDNFKENPGEDSIPDRESIPDVVVPKSREYIPVGELMQTRKKEKEREEKIVRVRAKLAEKYSQIEFYSLVFILLIILFILLMVLLTVKMNQTTISV